MRSLADTIVLVTPPSFGVDDPGIRSELEATVGEVRYNQLGHPLQSNELAAELGDVDGLIAGLDQIDRTVFAAAPRLRVIARYGVGVSNVDLRAASEHGGAQAAGFISVTKDDVRVCASGTSASQRSTRMKLMAAAVMTCWRWVFASPM